MKEDKKRRRRGEPTEDTGASGDWLERLRRVYPVNRENEDAPQEQTPAEIGEPWEEPTGDFALPPEPVREVPEEDTFDLGNILPIPVKPPVREEVNPFASGSGFFGESIPVPDDGLSATEEEDAFPAGTAEEGFDSSDETPVDGYDVAGIAQEEYAPAASVDEEYAPAAVAADEGCDDLSDEEHGLPTEDAGDGYEPLPVAGYDLPTEVADDGYAPAEAAGEEYTPVDGGYDPAAVVGGEYAPAVDDGYGTLSDAGYDPAEAADAGYEPAAAAGEGYDDLSDTDYDLPAASAEEAAPPEVPRSARRSPGRERPRNEKPHKPEKPKREKPEKPKREKPEKPKREKPEKAPPAPVERVPRKKRPWLAPVAVLLVLIGLALGGAAGMAVLAMEKDTIYNGVAVEGIDLSGMTYEQAEDAITALGHERFDDASVTALLPMDNSFTLTAAEAGLTYTVKPAARAAWNYGRDGSIVDNTVKYVKSRFLGQADFSWDKGMDPQADAEAIRSRVTAPMEQLNVLLMEKSIDIDLEQGEIRLIKGASGLTVDPTQLTQDFNDAFVSGAGSFTYEVPRYTDEDYDFQALYDDIHSELQEACIVYKVDYTAVSTGETSEKDPAASAQPTVTPSPTSSATATPEATPEPTPTPTPTPAVDISQVDFGELPYAIIPSSEGIDFDVAAAEQAWASASQGDTVVVPIQVEFPKVTTEELESKILADNLSKNWTMVKLLDRDYCEEVRTALSGSTSDRISNVKKACELINDTILCPGQTFSYNEALGQRTEANGWKPATAYANGEVRQEYGGGICQVSSTLYNAVLYANLEVVERECHQFQVGYLPWGMDATVSWGWPDFKFRNNTDYPVKIVAWVDDDTNECCVRIVGTDVDHTYVIIQFSNGEIFDDTGTYHDADGKPLSVGMAASTRRLVFHDGDDYKTATPISNEYEAYSTYKYHTEDIEARNVPLAAG